LKAFESVVGLLSSFAGFDTRLFSTTEPISY
jgi:hypothetical protein